MTGYQWLGAALIVIPILWWLVYMAFDDWYTFVAIMFALALLGSVAVGVLFLGGWLP
jgi:hypothetical protein